MRSARDGCTMESPGAAKQLEVDEELERQKRKEEREFEMEKLKLQAEERKLQAEERKMEAQAGREKITGAGRRTKIAAQAEEKRLT